jgi:hypothetical protein
MTNKLHDRRGILGSGLVAPVLLAAGATLSACSGGGEKDVGAVEDLMREHGILRRTILAFRESATALRGGRTSIPPRLPMPRACSGNSARIITSGSWRRLIYSLPCAKPAARPRP